VDCGVHERPRGDAASCRAQRTWQRAHRFASQHGKKLYYLYANQRPEYLALGAATASPLPIGFTVVKEAFAAVPLPLADQQRLEAHPELRLDGEGKYYRLDLHGRPLGLDPATLGTRYGLRPNMVAAFPELELRPQAAPSKGMRQPLAPPIRTLRTQDGWYRTGTKADLFIMSKVGEAGTPNSDDGWIYAVVSPDGRTVRGAGRMEHCAACHARAPFGRLFGPPRDGANAPLGG
jgi:hypothetical protein